MTCSHRTAEEVEDASLVVPKAMWWSYVFNVVLGVLILISMHTTPTLFLVLC